MSKTTNPIYKTCPVCDKKFPVCPPGKTSRTYPRNKQIFCSKICSYKARYRHGQTCNKLSPTQAAYIAGFLDSDGSIFLYKRGNKVALRVNFTNRNYEALDWIAKVTGIGGSVIARARNPIKHSVSYCTQMNADAARSLLEQVLPYLIIKRKQAEISIQFQKSLQNPSLNADRSWQFEVLAHVKLLNKRGP